MQTPYAYDFALGRQNPQNGQSPYLPWGPVRPPTASLAIEELDLIVFDERALRKYAKEECSVCVVGFKLEDEAYKLPCKHIFHNDCLLPWLKMNNTCPNCRHQLPTLEGATQPVRRGDDDDDTLSIPFSGSSQSMYS